MTSPNRFIALLLVALSLPVALSTAASAVFTGAPASFTVPVAASFSTTVAANRQNAIQLQGSDAEATALVYATTSGPSHGTLSGLNTATGAVVYTPAASYVGADSFTYTVTSGGETSAAGTVTLAVTNQKTRIIDTLADPGGGPRSGKVTFILTQPVTSPGGLISKGASVSATLNSSGQFDISVYPSRSLSPVAYYQVYVADANGGQTLMGIYDIPLSTSVINLSPYKVLDTNLAAQYTFASLAAVEALSSSISGAVYASMTSGNVTTALGFTPLRPSNNLSEVSNAATARTNIGLGTIATQSAASVAIAGGTVNNAFINSSVITTTTVNGDLPVTGAVTSENMNVPASLKAMISAGQIPYSADVVKGMVALFDASTLDLAEGDKVASWADLSGNGRHAVQATGALQPTYRQREALAEVSAPYVTAGGTTQYLTVPVPASSTRTFCAVVRNQSPQPAGYTIFVDSNNWLSSIAPNQIGRWTAYRKSNLGATAPAGFVQEYGVPCWRQNSATSISFFLDGTLVETFTPLDSGLSTATSFKIGPGVGNLRKLAVLDYGRAMTDAEVLAHSNMLRGDGGLSWCYEFIGRTSVDYDPVLASEGLIIRKCGVRGKRPLVILNHQAGQTEQVFLNATEQRAVTAALVEAGYIVAMSRQWDPNGLENSWGNDAALDANAALYAYVVANYQVDTARVAMIGMSMGGLSTALAFPDGRIPLKGAACFDCVFDLAHVYANGFAAGINTAYQVGGSGGVYATATAGHDPRLLATTSFAGKYFAFFANTDDAVVNYTQNTFDFQAQIASVAAEETITTTTGIGGHLAGISQNIPALSAFLARVFE